MKMKRTLRTALAVLLVGATGLTLASCGNSNKTNQSSSKNRTEKVTKHAKTPKATMHHSKKSNKSVKIAKKLTTPTVKKNTNVNKTDRKPAQLTNAQKNALAQEKKDNNLTQVNLGNGVNGHIDRGAGQIYVSFNLHGKQIVVHGNDVTNNANAVDKAKQIVAQSQNSKAPIKSGMIQAQGTK